MTQEKKLSQNWQTHQTCYLGHETRLTHINKSKENHKAQFLSNPTSNDKKKNQCKKNDVNPN